MENRGLPTLKKQRLIKDSNKQQDLNKTQEQHNIYNDSNLTQNPNAPFKFNNISRKYLPNRMLRQLEADGASTTSSSVTEATTTTETTSTTTSTTETDIETPMASFETTTQSRITGPEVNVDIYALNLDLEDYKGRPLPEDLRAMLMTNIDDDLYRCMEDLRACVTLDHSKEEAVCAVSATGLMKKFQSACDYHYALCKDGSRSWRELDDGNECNFDASDRDEAVEEMNAKKIKDGSAKILEVPEDKLPKDKMGPPPPNYEELIVVHGHNITKTKSNSSAAVVVDTDADKEPILVI